MDRLGLFVDQRAQLWRGAQAIIVEQAEQGGQRRLECMRKIADGGSRLLQALLDETQQAQDLLNQRTDFDRRFFRHRRRAAALELEHRSTDAIERA